MGSWSGSRAWHGEEQRWEERRGEGWSSGESCSSQLCTPNPPGTFGRDELFCLLCKWALRFQWWLTFCGTKPGCMLSYASVLCTRANTPKMWMDICNTKFKIMSNLIFSLGCEFNDSKTIKLHIICILWKKAIADFSLFFFLPPEGEFHSRAEQINLVRLLGV